MSKVLKIAGFGACMIKGFPFRPEVSFFNRAIKRLEEHCPVEANLVSLGGFPIDRARKHLDKVLMSPPKYVVVQFSSLDAGRDVGIREGLGLAERAGSSTGSLSSPAPVSPEIAPDYFKPHKPFGIAERVKWLVTGGIAAVRRLPSRTSRQVYLATMTDMVSAIIASGSEPVVLAPFPMVDLWSDYISKQFSVDVERLSREINCQIVEIRKLLAPYPWHEIFLNDGIHLTEFAHSLIAEELSRVIMNREGKSLTSESQPPPVRRCP